jgi:hypothetical protein
MNKSLEKNISSSFKQNKNLKEELFSKEECEFNYKVK